LSRSKELKGSGGPLKQCKNYIPIGQQLSMPERIRHFRSNLLSENSEIQLIQELINSGDAWDLGDDIATAARVFIKSGKCKLPSPKK